MTITSHGALRRGSDCLYFIHRDYLILYSQLRLFRNQLQPLPITDSEHGYQALDIMRDLRQPLLHLQFAITSTRKMHSLSGVVLLLGSPGAGKSLLGRLLLQAHAHSVHAFVNVGHILRATGKVDDHLQHPSSASKASLALSAREILQAACHDFKAACASSTYVSEYLC